MCYLLMPVNMLGPVLLTREKTHQIEEKEVKILHPIMYMTGLF